MKEIKEFLKNIEFLRKIVKKWKIKKEYNNDYNLFTKYYTESGNSKEQIEYRILLLVHSLEKGMCYENPRMFGEEKTRELIKLLDRYKQLNYDENSTAFVMGISILNSWIKIYENNKWENETYNVVKNYINNYKDKFIDIGSMKYTQDFREKYKDFDYVKAISTRHSVRDFLDKKITEKDFEECAEAFRISPTACNRQMCKLYYVYDKNKSDQLSKYIMGLGGFNKKSVNLFVVTYDISAFSFYGERNQGYFNAGLCAMNFANALHFKEIGSCFLQWGNTSDEEVKIKSLLNIPNNERIAVVIGAGYYTKSTLVPVSHRKSIKEISKLIK